MGTPSLRLRLVFEDRSILSKTQRSDGMNHSWLLLKSQQHPTISDICSHLLRIFKLHRSCPNGILLSMEGFTLPPFESTEILKDKEIICVKKKGGTTPDAGNLIDEDEDDVSEPGDDGLLLLENNKSVKAGEDQSTSVEFDEEQSHDEELPEEAVSKKRKASTNLPNSKKKRLRVGVSDDDEDEVETEETENVDDDASRPMKISSKKGTDIKAATSNKKVKSPSVAKRSEDLQENAKEVNQASDAPVAKKLPSRSARRKKAKRQWMRELAKIGKKKPQANSKPEVNKRKNEEANGQPKGLLYWKQASEQPVQNGDVGPVVTRPGHIRFETPARDRAAKQTGVFSETCKRNSGSSSKRKGQKWSREKFKKDEAKIRNKELFKMLFKDSQVPVIDINDFDKLPPCSEPKEGDVIAYRLLELNSSWIPEYSSFRAGRISYYDAKDIVLIPVPEYPIVTEQINDNGPNDPLYGEDGSLEINYSALVDVRNIMQHDPDAMEIVNIGTSQSQTPPSKVAAKNLVFNVNDNNIDVTKVNNPGEEVSPWDRFSSKITETPKPNGPNHSGLNPSSYSGPGPSTSTVPDADKPESSGVKEGQKGNSSDPWSAASKPDRVQENNASWSDAKQKAPTENNCENGSSWGRPWSAFVVSRASSVIQPDKENDWHAGSSRGSGKPWSRGAPRGRGRGQNRGRGRGRGQNG
ncbi:coilin [Helianthus annuus]|uniref:Putative coilin domain-containing protein n=1 Tax=Helianthus annuus TaxID=4232 RepID=A0A251T884_HELAN|nr:coilin [Helianthus annuus]